MSEDQNLEPEADVEGHKMKFKVDGPDNDDDVEGHKMKFKVDGPDSDDDDVEGHQIKPGGR
jgi:hypothetical protein